VLSHHPFQQGRSHIACAHKFSEYYFRLPGNAYWMIPSAAWRYWRLNDPFAANTAATLQRPLQRRLPMLLIGPGNPRKLPLPLKGSASHVIHSSLGPPTSSSKTAHLDRFSRFCTDHRRVSHYFTIGRYVPFKNCFFSFGERGPMVPRAHPSHRPKRHLNCCTGPKCYAVQCIVNEEELAPHPPKKKIARFPWAGFRHWSRRRRTDP